MCSVRIFRKGIPDAATTHVEETRGVCSCVVCLPCPTATSTRMFSANDEDMTNYLLGVAENISLVQKQIISL